MLFARSLSDTPNGTVVIRQSVVDGKLLDVWYSNTKQTVLSNMDEGLSLTSSSEGVAGEIELVLDSVTAKTIYDASLKVHMQLFSWLAKNPELHVIRVWNFVPQINTTQLASDHQNNYEAFNDGRFAAFAARYGIEPSTWPIPAASAVGTITNVLRLEFFAASSVPTYLENKAQVPARLYSKRFGKRPPLFARGAVFDNQGQRILISSGTAAIKGEDSLHIGDIASQCMEAIDNLRILVSQFNLRQHAIEFGFGLEDLHLLRVYYRYAHELATIKDIFTRAVDPDCALVFVQADICRQELLVEIEGIFVKKGEYQGARRKYEVTDGRIRVESFELHIAEHCNLRCHMCDAMSPYNQKKFLSLDTIQTLLTFLAKHVRADIFKLMGGEPLLHPDIVAIIEKVRASGITSVIRLTTNGLLLHTMPDAFWMALDRLTVSNYSSAPIKPKQVKLIHDKARQHNVILNLKQINQFNGVMIKSPIVDSTRVQRIYDNCWVRHRSLVVRNERFYKCTRAAYMDDFMHEFSIARDDADPITFAQGDGVALDDDFFSNALDYLNSDTPLHSCRYCLGASGKLIPHRQMTETEVAGRKFDEAVFYED